MDRNIIGQRSQAASVPVREPMGPWEISYLGDGQWQAFQRQRQGYWIHLCKSFTEAIEFISAADVPGKFN